MDFKIIFLALSFSSFSSLLGQNHSPSKSIEATGGLIGSFNARLDLHIAEIEVKNKNEVKAIYEKRTNHLIERLKNGHFLRSPLLDEYVSSIIEHILQGNPSLRRPVHVFIDRDPIPNAYCTGEGLIGINIGLLHRMENEHQLAYVIAHELAHWHLDHVNHYIQNNVEKYSARSLKSKERLADLKEGNIDAFKSLVYSSYKNSRKVEREADSLAVLIIKNTKYDFKAYQRAISLLDSVDYPKYNGAPPIKSFIDLEPYPFKEKWNNEISRSKLYNENAPSFLFDKDSLKTHPHIETRLASLNRLNDLTENTFNIRDYPIKTDEDKKVQSFVDFELVASSLHIGNFSYSLHYLKEMVHLAPKEQFFHQQFGRLFASLYYARKKHEFGKYVPPVIDQEHWLFDEICFMNNIRMSEYARLAYWYYNEKVDFTRCEEIDFLNFWNVANATNQTEKAQNILKSYLELFPDGSLREEFEF